MARREEDVLGLDVAMHQSHRVGMPECVSDLFGDLECVLDGELLLPPQAIAQRLALDVRHRVEELAVRFTAVVEREDVRVVELGRDLDLAEEALTTERRRELGTQHLQGDLTIEFLVLGEVHHSHPATA
jgi:hypothetical protein